MKRTDPVDEFLALLWQLRPSDYQRRRPVTTLTGAALEENLDLMRAFITKGADVNERTRGFGSPLQAAASAGRLAAAELLIQSGASTGKTATSLFSPVDSAVKNGHEAILEALISAGVDLSAEPNAIPYAANSGRPRCLKLLLEQGASRDRAAEALRMAAAAGRYSCVKQLVEAGVDARSDPAYQKDFLGKKLKTPETPLDAARKGGHQHIADYLEGKGDDARAQAAEAQLLSPEAGLAQAFEALRALGGERDEPRLEGEPWRQAHAKLLEMVQNGGTVSRRTAALVRGKDTALILASEMGLREIAGALLRAGQPLNAKGADGRTALIAAAEAGRGEMILDLLAAKADPNVKCSRGRTALMAAAGWSLESAVRALLDAGADPQAKSKMGDTAMTEARGVNEPEIKAMVLAAAKAKPGKKVPPESTTGALRVVTPRRKARGTGIKVFNDFYGNPEWSLVAVEADVQAVAGAYARLKAAPRWEQDIAAREVRPAGEFVFVLGLKGSKWSYLLRSLGHLTLEICREFPKEVSALSKELGTRAVTYMSEDTGGETWSVIYDKGTEVETAVDSKRIKLVFAEEEICPPPCVFGSDGFRTWLEVVGLTQDEISRLDFVALED